LVKRQESEVVVTGSLAEILIGRGDMGKNLYGYRIDETGRDLITCKRRASRAVGIAGKGIIDCGGRGAQIARADGCGNHGHRIRIRLVIDRPQIVGEKEELVLPNRPAEVSAGVVINKMADGRVK